LKFFPPVKWRGPQGLSLAAENATGHEMFDENDWSKNDLFVEEAASQP
jgi:hypothetical protein